LPELKDCDILVSTSDCPEIDIPAHKVFLAARSPVLRSLFVEGPRSVGAVGDFIPSTTPGEKARLVFKDVKLQTLLILLYYIYTDSLVDIWNQSNIHNSRMQHYRTIRSERYRFPPKSVLITSQKPWKQHLTLPAPWIEIFQMPYQVLRVRNSTNRQI